MPKIEFDEEMKPFRLVQGQVVLQLVLILKPMDDVSILLICSFLKPRKRTVQVVVWTVLLVAVVVVLDCLNCFLE